MLFFVLVPSVAQNTSSLKTNVQVKYEEYFKLDRQNIHLHLNKTTFATGENIWFSIYLFNRKKNTLATQSQYVYVDLLNSLGGIIDTKTILYSNGIGVGEFSLKTKLNSGNYHLRAYTQEMNDFIEDESSTFDIEIINFESSQVITSKNAPEDINTKIEPEGGHFITDVFGSAAIYFSDNQGRTIYPDSVFLRNSQNSSKSLIKIDSLGIGAFSIIPKNKSNYSINAFINNKRYTKHVPHAKLTGYSLAVDNDFTNKKVLITINSNTLTPIKNLSLYIHKDGNINSIPLGEKSKHEIVVPHEYLFSGINTITVFENDSVPIAERLVFIHPKTTQLKPILLNIKAEQDSLTLFIKTADLDQKLNNLSVSVVPVNNFPEQTKTGIQTSFFLNNLSPEIVDIINKIPFLEKESAKYDLDKFLILNGNGKYSWNKILNQKITNTIDYSTSIEGYVNLFGEKNDSLLLLLYSKDNGLFEQTVLNQDSKFKFKGLPLVKGSKFTLTLLNKKGKPIYANFFFVEKPILKPYNKLFNANSDSLSTAETGELLLTKVEILDEAIVRGSRLKRQQLLGGRYNGRKVDSTLWGVTTLGSFMQSKILARTLVPRNYPDPKRAGTIQLTRVNELNFPRIIFDGIYSSYVMDYANILMEDLDEIYYRKDRRSDAGLFVVYSKASFKNRPLPESQKNSKDFIVKHGYQIPQPFIRPSYYNIAGDEFRKYGIISWHPVVKPKNKGVLTIKVPNDYKDKIKLSAEGFGEDNFYISHQLIIELPNNKKQKE